MIPVYHGDKVLLYSESYYLRVDELNTYNRNKISIHATLHTLLKYQPKKDSS